MSLAKLQNSLKAAVTSALDQMIRISESAPKERRPKEAIIQCELYRYYTNLGYLVHPEAGYFSAESGRKASCDLRIIDTQGDELWVEIKVAHDGGGLITKIDEEKRKWEKDGEKLDNEQKNSRAVFLLIGLTEEEPTSSERRFFQEVKSFWGGGYQFTEVDTRLITWPNAGVKYVTAWYWIW